LKKLQVLLHSIIMDSVSLDLRNYGLFEGVCFRKLGEGNLCSSSYTTPCSFGVSHADVRLRRNIEKQTSASPRGPLTAWPFCECKLTVRPGLVVIIIVDDDVSSHARVPVSPTAPVTSAGSSVRPLMHVATTAKRAFLWRTLETGSGVLRQRRAAARETALTLPIHVVK